MIEMLYNGIKLYHGSYCEVKHPELGKCRKYKDFGRGFYLTTDLDQATRFAKLSLRKAVENNTCLYERNIWRDRFGAGGQDMYKLAPSREA